MALGATINTNESAIAVELYLAGENAKSFFSQLEDDRELIAEELQMELEWMRLPQRRACRIMCRHPMNALSKKETWTSLQTWMISTLEKMHKTFAPRVKNLSAD